MKAHGIAPAGAGKMDIRVEANGGPGAQGETTLSPEDEARVAEARGDVSEIAERFGAGGDARSEVRAESLSREDIRVENRIRGGSAPPQGVFPAHGGEARSTTVVEAPEARRVRVAANTHGGDARLSGDAGPATARLTASAAERLEARAAAQAGAGGEFADADAHAQGEARDGRLTAHAATRLHEEAGPMDTLVAEVSITPRGRLPSDPSTAGRSRLVGIQALAGPAAADEQSETLPRHAVVRLVPYPAGEPDSLFALMLAAQHPVAEATARRLRKSTDPAVRSAAEPLTISIVFQWPENLPPYSMRGTELKHAGNNRPEITLTGLHDEIELGSLRLNGGTPTHSAEAIFGGAWDPSELLVSGKDAAPRMNGIRIVATLEPGQRLAGRLLVVR
jgi:hypothetical protein